VNRVGGLMQALSPLLYGVILVLRHISSPDSSRPPWRPRGLPASVSKSHTERALMRGYSTRPAWLCQWVGSGYGGAVAMGGVSQETTVAMASPGSVLQLHPLLAACSRALARLPGRPARVAPRERRRSTGGWTCWRGHAAPAAMTGPCTRPAPARAQKIQEWTTHSPRPAHLDATRGASRLVCLSLTFSARAVGSVLPSAVGCWSLHLSPRAQMCWCSTHAAHPVRHRATARADFKRRAARLAPPVNSSTSADPAPGHGAPCPRQPAARRPSGAATGFGTARRSRSRPSRPDAAASPGGTATTIQVRLQVTRSQCVSVGHVRSPGTRTPHPYQGHTPGLKPSRHSPGPASAGLGARLGLCLSERLRLCLSVSLPEVEAVSALSEDPFRCLTRA
jgi:hypothetical protein